MSFCISFKTGKHIDSSGQEQEWTEKDLDQIAEATNKSLHDPPVVIGHPRDNKPAWGWVDKTVKRIGDTLQVKFKDIHPAFKDWVNNQKLFTKRSISLYPDKSIRHIGFLGAQPPAIKGLPDFCFNEEDNFTLYEFSDSENNDKKGDDLMPDTIIKDDFLAKQVEELKAQLAERDKAISDFAEKKEKDMAENQAKLIAEKAAIETELQKAKDFAEKEASEKKVYILKVAEMEKEKKTAEYKSFCEENKTKVTPAIQPKVIGLMEVLDSQGEYEFAEVGKKNSLEVFKSVIKDCFKEQVSTDEIATKKTAADVDTNYSSDYAEFNGKNVNQKDLALMKAADEYMAANPGTNFDKALKIVSKGGK